jgi:tetratricopeptide (TPR) repeat protein
LRILVVSDKAFEIKQLKEYLTELPYSEADGKLDFYSADSGKSCVDKVDAENKEGKPFDIILIPHKMTKVSGLMIAQSLAPKKPGAIILIVDELSKHLTDEGAKAGIAAYLKTPVTLEELKKVITDIAEGRAANEMRRMAAEKNMLGLTAEPGDASVKDAIAELNETILAKVQHSWQMAPWSILLKRAIVGIYMEVGKFVDAIPILKKMIKIDFGDKEAHKSLAECYKRSGKSFEDLPLLEKMLAENPNSTEVHYKIASYYMREGDTTKAVEHYKLAAAVHKEEDGVKIKADALCGLGTAIMAEGEKTGDASKFSEAFAELKKAIHTDPTVSASYFRMAEALKKLDKEKEANAVLEVALKKEPANPAEWLEWFFFHLLKGDKDKAKDALENAMKADPENQVTLCLAGEAYFRQSMYDEAVNLFEKAVGINPSDIRLYNWLGICYRRLKQTGRAIARYKRALEIDPEDFNVHFNLGRAHHVNSDFTSAREAYENALKYNKDLSEAKTALEQLPQVGA